MRRERGGCAFHHLGIGRIHRHGEGAREVRHRFLQDAAGVAGARRIALGHTANEQAETLLMRLIRGAGVTGLSAIPLVRENIIRPLIDITRAEVLAYLDEIGQDFVTDPSNLKPVYTRNGVRQEVLPVLERFNPRIVEALAATADVLRDESQTIALLIGSLRTEKGCRRCDFCRSMEDENALCILEEWDTRKNLNSHLKSELFSVLRGAMSLLQEPYEKAVWDGRD